MCIRDRSDWCTERVSGSVALLKDHFVTSKASGCHPFGPGSITTSKRSKVFIYDFLKAQFSLRHNLPTETCRINCVLVLRIILV